MESVDICAASSTGDNKRRVNKKKGVRHKGLDLRKTVARPLAMQSEDKHGPKKIAEEWEQSTLWSSSKKKPPREAQQSQSGTGDSGRALRVTCSQCKDNMEYLPKDLERHFEEKHTGNVPVFPCHVCNFSTHKSSYFQVHLLSHKNTFSSCSICNDGVQRTWSEYSAHLSASHCPNGKYSCERCQTFSTSDVSLFLEHMYVHSLDLGVGGDMLVHEKDESQLTSVQTSRCPHCGYEASQKWLIAQHVGAVHVCQNRNQKKKLCPIALKPNDSIPKMKPRLTRSAVREMCWLTQDCLSLPGREFLSKYCSLSDPQTTLEKTQEFLLKSVTRETGDQKWTKALKSVLSHVPQDMDLFVKPENGVLPDSSDLTVLTVKNRITLAQNGATYVKRLKLMTSPDSETACPDSSACDSQSAIKPYSCQPTVNEQPVNELHDISALVQNEQSKCTSMQENGESHEVKTEQDIDKYCQKLEESLHDTSPQISSDLSLANESEGRTLIHKSVPKVNRRSQRRKRKAKLKACKKSPEPALKIVLKKNPVKEKQWLSQSPLSPSGDTAINDSHELPNAHLAEDKTVKALQHDEPAEDHQKKWTKGSRDDQSEGITSILQSTPCEDVGPSLTPEPPKPKTMAGTTPVFPEGMKQETVAVQTSTNSIDGHVLDGSDEEPQTGSDEVTFCGSKSSSVTTPQGQTDPQASCPALLAEWNDLSAVDISEGEESGDSQNLPSSIPLPNDKAIQQEPSPASGHLSQLVPKNVERTLKLVAINPSQLVKRPAGDQPVVVLNHPDADIPEVARIMEVVNRYRGEVQKVVLSRRTLQAFSALNSEPLEMGDPTDSESDPMWRSKNPVQERFSLKFKLRRLTRKKYEMLGTVSPSRSLVMTFQCWFCGRIFTSQETWLAHRQRHLMEWNRSNCEKPSTSRTLDEKTESQEK
ncbi:uncharacterized protein znf518a isoform 1-T4 [Pholidichthys leucotaenia]